MSQTDELTMVRAAELYYQHDKSQDEIGSLLGLTRWKVGRLLAQARGEGVVRIEIVHPRARRLSVEHELRRTLGLRDAVVIPDGDPHELQSRLAAAAADYLAALRPVPRTLGLSWGRTIDGIAAALPEGWATGVDVVQINGGVSLTSRGSTAAASAMAIAERAGGSATLLPTPAILERRETKLAIEGDRTVATVLERGAAASAYLYSAGAADSSSVLVESGYLATGEVETLVSRGAVGDVVGRFIDAQGRVVDEELDRRTVGIGLDRLRAAEWAIAVIGGRQKHSVARAVATSGLCSVLVTDEETARAVLEEDER
jgi:deoxyribonucleoside regulator